MTSKMAYQVNKLHLSVGLIILALLGSFLMKPSPINVLLRNGECSSAKNSIRAEEKIGLILWQGYENLWQSHETNLGDSSVYTPLVNSLIDLFQSDQRVYRIANAHPNCFSASKNAYARTQATTTSLFIKNLKKWIYSGQIFDKDYYSKYYSFFDDSTDVAPTPLHGTSV
jgi:hypothetical protein